MRKNVQGDRMKVGDLVNLKDRTLKGFGVAIVLSVDPRPGCSMCTIVGSMTDGKPLPYLMKHFEVISENR